MVIIDTTAGEPDMGSLFTLLSELMEQTNSHRTYTAQLHGRASEIKAQAIHSQTGFVLRRFNMEMKKEDYDAELERMNAAMMAENLALQHDNKQLNALIKEYETTLETVMGLFRQRAHEVQSQELARIREYESRLLERETEVHAASLSSETALLNTYARLSTLLRRALRALGGEAPDGDADWALERECELSRLERENALLHALLAAPGGGGGGGSAQAAHSGPEEGRSSVVPAVRHSTLLGGPRGTVGPFGTYRKPQGS
ncbi:hypothetical protein BC834DRAFT_884599 [Gloeopeniophorella convolvens]|nr:hypothetical protein BC834DRAFT_884599 [Gloeopeniophorella convolvens]